MIDDNDPKDATSVSNDQGQPPNAKGPEEDDLITDDQLDGVFGGGCYWPGGDSDGV